MSCTLFYAYYSVPMKSRYCVTKEISQLGSMSRISSIMLFATNHNDSQFILGMCLSVEDIPVAI